MKRKLKRNNGITLIALVITIIVLLILAGVTIAALSGDNGILQNATKAKEQTELADEKEKVKLSTVGALAKDNGGEIKRNYLNEELTSYIGEEGEDYTLSETAPFVVTYSDSGRSYVIYENGIVEENILGTYYETDEDITVGGKPVTIPGGATISGISSETDINNGLVIYITKGDEITDWNADEDENGIKDVQEDYDQFVWVPVEKAYVTETEIGGISDSNIQNYVTENKIYPMAIQLNDGTYKGISYRFEENSNGITIIPFVGNDPFFLEHNTYGDTSPYNNVGITPNSLKAEFKTMVERVDSKKGFWVGRYETSHMVNDHNQDDTNRVKVIKGTTEGIDNANWYRMYAQQKSYKKLALVDNTAITSSMMWGCQQHQILIWMKDVKNTVYPEEYYIMNALGMGFYNGTEPIETGSQENYKVKNIYDLAGNAADWLLDKSDRRIWLVC